MNFFFFTEVGSSRSLFSRHFRKFCWNVVVLSFQVVLAYVCSFGSGSICLLNQIVVTIEDEYHNRLATCEIEMILFIFQPVLHKKLQFVWLFLFQNYQSSIEATYLTNITPQFGHLTSLQ
jgi:hypothetical protein